MSGSFDLPDRIRVCSFQWDIRRTRSEDNIEVLRRLLDQAAEENPNLIVFPEMWSRSFCGKDLPGEAAQLPERLEFCCRIAKDMKTWVAAGTLPEPLPSGKVYNSLHLIDSGGKVRYVYRKIHLFPLTNEQKYFTAGKEIPQPCVTGAWRIGAGICFDLRFPELFRRQAKMGANLFIVPAQFPNPRKDIFANLTKARAVENLSCVVSVNRTGAEGDLTFFGGSMSADPSGMIRAETQDFEGFVTSTFTASEIDDYRRQYPFLDNTPLLD